MILIFVFCRGIQFHDFTFCRGKTECPKWSRLPHCTAVGWEVQGNHDEEKRYFCNIYTDNYSCYHFVCSHLPVVVHGGVFPNHLYMYCRVTLIKKIKVLDFTLYIIAVKYSIEGSILIINTCKLTLKLISPPPPNCIVTLLVIPYYIYYLSKLFNPWILLWDCYTEKCTEGNKISVKPKF